MPETPLTINDFTLGLSAEVYSGLDPAAIYEASDETNGNSAVNASGRLIIFFKNSGVGVHVITFTRAKGCSQGHQHNPAVTVAATPGEVWFGPLSREEFGAVVLMAYDAGSTGEVTQAAMDVP